MNNGTKCPHCGRYYKRLSLHKNMCAAMPNPQEIAREMHEDKRLNSSAIAERCNVSNQFVREWLVHNGLGHFAGRRRDGTTRNRKFVADICNRCGIRVFDKPPKNWGNLGMRKFGEHCAECYLKQPHV